MKKITAVPNITSIVETVKNLHITNLFAPSLCRLIFNDIQENAPLPDYVKTLIKTKTNSFGYTILHTLAEDTNSALDKHVLHHAITICTLIPGTLDTKNKNNKTPLDCAVMYLTDSNSDHQDRIKLLLGTTNMDQAIDICKQQNKTHFLTILNNNLT